MFVSWFVDRLVKTPHKLMCGLWNGHILFGYIAENACGYPVSVTFLRRVDSILP